MIKTRFQHLYTEIDDLFRFECDAQTLREELHLKDDGYDALFELSYRDPEGFAVYMAFGAYQTLLGYGACDDDGMVLLSELESQANTRAQDFIKRRSELVIPELQDDTLDVSALNDNDLDALIIAIANDATQDLLPELPLKAIRSANFSTPRDS